jgi:beta-lactamase class D
VEKSRAHTLHAKAGTAAGREAVMWWVGWIERQGRPQAYFAMNLTAGPKTALADRFEIARGILRESGVL